MYPLKNPARDARPANFSLDTLGTIKLLLVCLMTASVPYALYVRVDSKARASSQSRCRLPDRASRTLTLRTGDNAHGFSRRAESDGSVPIRSGAAAIVGINCSGCRRGAGLITGYAYNGMGIVTVQHGNPEAFAPKDDSIFLRMQQGYNPDSLLPVVETYLVPESPDFLEVGDFNYDNRKDVLVGTSGGGLYLLSGDGRGALNAPEQICCPDW